MNKLLAIWIVLLACVSAQAQTVSSTGTINSNAIPLFQDGKTITNSSLTDNGTTVATPEAFTASIISGSNLLVGTLTITNPLTIANLNVSQTNNVGTLNATNAVYVNGVAVLTNAAGGILTSNGFGTNTTFYSSTNVTQPVMQAGILKNLVVLTNDATGSNTFINLSLGNTFYELLTNNTYIYLTNWPTVYTGEPITIILVEDATGTRVPTWSTTNFNFNGGTGKINTNANAMSSSIWSIGPFGTNLYSRNWFPSVVEGVISSPSGTALQFQNGGTNIFYIDPATGAILWNSDHTYSIGANGANRPQNIFAFNFILGATLEAAQYTFSTGGSFIANPSDGVIEFYNAATTGFNRLQFGGTTASYLGLGTNGASLLIEGANGVATSSNGVYAGFIAGNITNGAPTIVTNSGAGSATGTVTLDSNANDISGTITLNTGTAPLLGATVFTLTYGTLKPRSTHVVFSPANNNAAALSGVTMVYVGTQTTTNFTFSSGGTGIAGSTTYTWNYLVTL